MSVLRYPKVVVGLAVVAVLLGCAFLFSGIRYDYVPGGNGRVLRVNRLTGATDVLRRDVEGRDRWIPMKSEGEIAAERAASDRAFVATDQTAAAQRASLELEARAARDRCAGIAVPDDVLKRLDIEAFHGNFPFAEGHVKNNSDWTITRVDLAFTYPSSGSPVTVTGSVPDRGSFAPSAELQYRLRLEGAVAGTPPLQKWGVVGATGRPADCPS